MYLPLRVLGTLRGMLMSKATGATVATVGAGGGAGTDAGAGAACGSGGGAGADAGAGAVCGSDSAPSASTSWRARTPRMEAGARHDMEDEAHRTQSIL